MTTRTPPATAARPATDTPSSPGVDGASTPATAASRQTPVTTVALLGSAALTITAAAIIAPSLPAMVDVFPDDPQWLVRLSLTVTSAAIGVAAPVAGALADRVGAGRILPPALALYALAGTAGLYTPTLATLLISRAVLGLAVAGVMIGVTALISARYEGPARTRMLGLQASAASFGGVLLLPLAGVLASSTWRAPFWIYGSAVVVLPLAVIGLRRQGTPPAVSRSRTSPAARATTDPAVRDHPQPPRAPRRTVGGIYLLGFLGTVIFFMAPTQLPFQLQHLQAGSGVVGVVVAISTASSALFALLLPAVARRLTPPQVAALAVALLGLGWLVVGSGDLVTIVIGSIIGGAGVGLIIPTLNLWLAAASPVASRGRVLSGAVASIFLGQFASPLLLQPLVHAVGIPSAFTLTGVIALTVGVVFAGAARIAAHRSPADNPSDRPAPDRITGPSTKEKS